MLSWWGGPCPETGGINTTSPPSSTKYFDNCGCFWNGFWIIYICTVYMSSFVWLSCVWVVFVLFLLDSREWITFIYYLKSFSILESIKTETSP